MPFLLSVSFAIYAIQTDGNRSNYVANLNYEESRTLDLLEGIKRENEKDKFMDNGECIFSSNNFSTKFKERILECRKTFGEGVLFFGDSHSKDLFNVFIQNSNLFPKYEFLKYGNHWNNDSLSFDEENEVDFKNFNKSKNDFFPKEEDKQPTPPDLDNIIFVGKKIDSFDLIK